MMLNSNNGVFITFLLCSFLSFSAASKVYSWKDKNGDIHYSQFPKKMVEKNVAQSRATRKQAKNKAVQQSSEKEGKLLLNGLDDIVATATALREPEKKLKRNQVQTSQSKTAVQSKKLVDAVTQEQSVQRNRDNAIVEPSSSNVTSERTVVKIIKNKRKLIKKNSFLAAIKQKLNRKQETPLLEVKKRKRPNQFLDKINKKRFPSGAKQVATAKDDPYLAEVNNMLAISAAQSKKKIKTK